MSRIFKYYLFIGLIFSSCTKSDPGPVTEEEIPPFLKGKGVFLLNEGNFTRGNGSLSFYSYDSSKLYNNVFLQINNRALGDVPNSMGAFNGKNYIVVNNSGTIEVTESESIVSEKTVTGFVSPRNIAFVNKNKAYVSSLYSKSVAVLDLQKKELSGTIKIGRTSECISIVNERAFISNWFSGKMIFVVNTLTDLLVDSVEVAPEPESMVTDKNKKLWVLCNGGFTREHFAEIIAIDPSTYHIVKRLTFPSINDSPSCLQIDGTGEVIYYLDKGVRKMHINDADLPAAPFIPESSRLFYKMAVNPENGDVFVTDAVDYTKNGYLLHYSREGILLETLDADIIPGAMCFKN